MLISPIRLLSVLLACPVLIHGDKRYFWVASSTQATISSYWFDDVSGTIGQFQKFPSAELHTSIAVDHAGMHLFATLPGRRSIGNYTTFPDHRIMNHTAVELKDWDEQCFVDSVPDISVIAGVRNPQYNYASMASNSKNCAAIFTFSSNGTTTIAPVRRSTSSTNHIDHLAIDPSGTRLYALSSRQSMLETYVIWDDGMVWMNYDERYFPQNEPRVIQMAVGDNHLFAISERSNFVLSAEMGPTRVPKPEKEGSDIIKVKKLPAFANTNEHTDYHPATMALSDNNTFLAIVSPSDSDHESGFLSVFPINKTSGELADQPVSRKLNTTATEGAKAWMTIAPTNDTAVQYIAVSSCPAAAIEVWKVGPQDTDLSIVGVREGSKESCGPVAWF